MHKVLLAIGTRPEAIKLAPVILALRADPRFETRVCLTAQHRQMLDQVLEVFAVQPDVDLDLMRPDQSLGDLTARAIESLDRTLKVEKPDLVLVQGDTTTTFTAALTAFYNHMPVGHVEAGLRTGNLDAPWPEEANRALTSRLANLHFAPTELSRQNLLREDLDENNIHVTGNTVIDALFFAVDKIRAHAPNVIDVPGLPLSVGNGKDRLVLITGHRRESFGPGLESICTAIAELARGFSDVHFVYPVHLNPNVQEPVERILGQPQAGENVHLIAPLAYLPFVALMDRSTIILTDSGGIQEEAPSLGKPVLVTRDTTERPEAIEAGTVELVGTNRDVIIDRASRLLTDEKAYAAMSRAHNPYGDGKSAARIRDLCVRFLDDMRC
ncbi:non-hydrolyzing UDP-N-acetylglucosamine 2-epimerase [Myxococcota bacterium]